MGFYSQILLRFACIFSKILLLKNILFTIAWQQFALIVESEIMTVGFILENAAIIVPKN